jgi:hypothetical protein
MIPDSLAQVAEQAASGESFDRSLRNFLDGFNSHPRKEALLEEPRRLRDVVAKLGLIEDAYLAATAEWLAWRHELPAPAWAFSEDRKLHRPWFASEMPELRAVLLWESPAAFRSRNLFVSENALTRA